MKYIFLAAALLIIFAALAISATTHQSATCDEVAHHIPVGYVLLTKWDFKMDTSQPPLSRYIIALPLKIFMKIKMPEDKNEWRRPDRSSFGRDFFYKYNHDPKKMVLICRIPVIIIGVLCGLLLFIWASSIYGNKAGLLSLFLYCLSPTILAHAGLATTDMIATFFIFLSAYTFWMFLKDICVKRMVFAGISLGLAQLSKYNAILLYPVFLLFLVFEFRTITKTKVGMLLKRFLIVILLSVITAWAGYGFDFQPLLKDAMRAEEKIAVVHDVISRLPAYFSNMHPEKFLLQTPIPLGSHILGILGVFQHSSAGHSTFFWGEWSDKSNALYFLISFLIKNPIPMIILIVIGLFILVKRGIGRAERMILIIAASFFIAASFSGLQIGIRHILPIYPFCLMVAGTSEKLLKKRNLNLIVVLLLMWQLYSALATWPNYIGYFNESVGRTKNGYKILRDSNIDWGQDLPALADYMSKSGKDEVVLYYFGQADPCAYGIKYKEFSGAELIKPENKIYAISAQYLEGVVWTKDHEPTALAGSSILIYDFSKRNAK